MGTWASLVVDVIIDNNTNLITDTFTSLWDLIASHLGVLIIFGLAVAYLFYVKRMAKVRNARG